MKRLLHTALRCALLGALVMAVPVLRAQTAGSSLRGIVRTDDGHVAPDAIVQARNEQTGALRVTTSDAKGRYQLQALPPGRWLLVARLTDGRVSESTILELRLQNERTLDLMVGGGVTERIEVSASANLIDRKETAGKLRIDADQVGDLPIAGRVFTDLALLDSSVRPAAEGSFYGEVGSVFLVNGASGRSNSFLVDGLDNNDLTSGTSLSSFYSQQVIAEFVLLTHQFSPEFGRATGGVLNIVTKQGGNDRHVEGFAQGALPDWGESGSFVDALPAGGAGTDRSRQFSTGFNLSGPFKKDKAFYFLAYERQQNDRLIAYTGVDADGVAGGRFLAPDQSDNFFVRTDFNLSNKSQLMFRLSFDDRQTQGVNVGGLFTPEAGFGVAERDLTFAGSLTTVISPRLVSESRFLYSDSSFDQIANSSLSGINRPSGIFGGNPLNSQLRNESKSQIVENLTFTRGAHTFKLGADITRSTTDLDVRFNPNGNFSYDSDFPFLEPGDCGNLTVSIVNQSTTNPVIPCPGIVGFDDDGDGAIDEDGRIDSYPTVFSFVFGQPSNTLSDTKFGVFVQDHWQATPAWFFEYGVRYDVGTYELPASARVDSTIPNGGARRDTNNIAPRFGFTWTPGKDGRTVVRGGGGLFYDKLVLAFPAVAAVTSGTQIGLFFPAGFTVEFNEQVVEDLGIDQVLPSLLFLPELTLQFSTTPTLEVPYATQFNLGIDTPVGARGAFRANVTRSQGYHLALLKDLNQPIGQFLPGIGSCPNNLDPVLKIGVPCHGNDPLVGSIAALATEGRSWYTGVDVGLRYHGARSWIDASYTWSRAEDTHFDPLKSGISLPPDSENIVVTERGRADGDRRHRVVVSGDAPLAGGFRFSGVLSVSSGIAFNVTTGTDVNVDGFLNDRPEGVRRNAGADSDLAAINAFRDSEGLTPFTRLREPSFAQVDLKVYLPIAFKERRATGNFYLQVFNLFDRENLGLIDGRAVSQNFGRGITLAGPPRTVVSGVTVGF